MADKGQMLAALVERLKQLKGAAQQGAQLEDAINEMLVPLIGTTDREPIIGVYTAGAIAARAIGNNRLADKYINLATELVPA